MMVMVDSAATKSNDFSNRDEEADAAAGARAGEGDARRFEQIVTAHQAHISRLVRRLLAWSDDTDDVVQEVFLAAWKGLGKFRGGRDVSAWLTRIAVNKCRNYWRRQAVRWRGLARVAGTAQWRSSIEPDAAAMDCETFQRVRRAVQGLPRRCREVVVLTYLQEMSREETAEALGVSRQCVDVRLHRARRRLKGVLGGLVEE